MLRQTQLRRVLPRPLRLLQPQKILVASQRKWEHRRSRIMEIRLARLLRGMQTSSVTTRVKITMKPCSNMLIVRA
jgi:hypothetical protein